MSARESRFPYAPVLAFVRTRLLGAVAMPALVGAAYTARRGPVPFGLLGLVLVGLAAAELLNLFGADYARWREGGRSEEGVAGVFLLPGNPVVAPSRLEPRRIPAVLLPLALLGTAVLVYFTFAVGIKLLIFLAAAVAVGALYVLSPFPYAFLSTAVIPPLISGGTHLALTGETAASAFWAGVPIAWISLAVILGYRVLYAGRDDAANSRAPKGRLWRRRKTLVVSLYCLAGATVAAWVPVGFLPPATLLALVPLAACLAWLVALLRPGGSDPVPATAVGVLMHTLTSTALALGLMLG